MRQGSGRWFLLFGACLSVPTWARPPASEVESGLRAGPATSASDIPALASILARANWTATPELSGVFRAGSIFEVQGGGACFVGG